MTTDRCWPGHIAIEGKDGCLYILRHDEWAIARRRGKAWKRQDALRRRVDAQADLESPATEKRFRSDAGASARHIEES